MILNTVSPRSWTTYQIWTLTEEEEGHFSGAGNAVALLNYDYLVKFGYADGRELPVTPDPDPWGPYLLYRGRAVYGSEGQRRWYGKLTEEGKFVIPWLMYAKTVELGSTPVRRRLFIRGRLVKLNIMDEMRFIIIKRKVRRLYGP
jgi:hypothetical protein